jgi:hypothetical protein
MRDRRGAFPTSLLRATVIWIALAVPIPGLPAPPPALAQGDPALKSQDACPQVPPVGGCVDFTSAAPPPGVLRSIALDAPGPGSALVLVNGSGFCNNEVGETDNHVQLVTQIVANRDATPSHKGQGGLFHYLRLPPWSDQHGAAISINLSSSRVFPIGSAGTRRYYLKLGVVQLPFGVRCVLYSDTMSVLFIPN